MYICMYVFQGLCVYSTSSVVPEYSTLRIIIKCAGGDVSNWVMPSPCTHCMVCVYKSINEVNICVTFMPVISSIINYCLL